MRALALFAALCAAAVVAVGMPSGAAAQACDSTGTVDVLPLHGNIGVNHDVDLILVAKFELNRLVPKSIVFHVSGPVPNDYPGGDDTFGAIFKASAIGNYSVYATWQLYDCTDRSIVTNEQSATVPFTIYPEQRPAARFKASVNPGSTSSGAPIFAVDAVCPPSTIRTTEPLSLTVYWAFGKKMPTHASPHSGITLAGGCGGKGGRPPKAKNYRWGVVRGATIGVLPGNSVRVLAEVKSGKKIVGQTRVRFAPRGNREALLRDSGPCKGGCVKRIFKY